MTTFKVIDSKDGGVLNHVKCAKSEGLSDPAEVATEKRRAEALHKKQEWITKYDPDMQLSVVECDDWGTPLLEKAVKSKGRAA